MSSAPWSAGGIVWPNTCKGKERDRIAALEKVWRAVPEAGWRKSKCDGFKIFRSNNLTTPSLVLLREAQWGEEYPLSRPRPIISLLPAVLVRKMEMVPFCPSP